MTKRADSFRPRITKKTFLGILSVIALVGFLLRLIISAELMVSYSLVTQPSDLTDIYTYQKLSKQILDGGYDFSKGFYYQPFYYTVFLPLIYKIGGISPWSVVVAQSALGLGIVWLIGITFARIYGKTVGLIGALLTAVNRYLIFYTPFTLIAILQAFWMVLLLWSTVYAFNHKRVWIWLGVGVINGLAMVTRGNVVLLAPIILLLAARSFRGTFPRFWCGALLYCFGLVLPQLPYAIVNYHAHHRWVGASTAAGAVLALGNTPESPPGGRESHYGPGPMEYPPSYYEWTAQARQEGDGRVSVLNQIARWVRKEPLAYLELKLRMLLLFWNQTDIPNNVALSTFAQKVKSPLFSAPFLNDFFAIGSLGLAGMILSILRYNRKPLRVYCVGVTGIYCLSIIIFYVLSRFRLPIIPLLCGFSGYTLVNLLRSSRQYLATAEKGQRFLLKIAICFVAFLTVGYGFDIYRGFWEKDVIRLVRPSGVRLVFNDKTLVKDHGPVTFGGWITQPMHETHRVAKDLVLADLDWEGRNLLIRFPVSSPRQTSFLLSIDCMSDRGPDQIQKEIKVDPGFQWVRFAIDTKCAHVIDGIMTLTLNFATQLDVVGLYFDSQRQYGRTRINGNIDDGLGEMVLELVIKDSAIESGR